MKKIKKEDNNVMSKKSYKQMQNRFSDPVFDSKYKEVEIPVLVQVMNELQIPFVSTEEIIKTESGITVIVKIKEANKNEGGRRMKQDDLGVL